jgi:hypothetical protein
MAASDVSRRSRDATRKFVSLGTIGILLGVSAWLRPLQPAEWLPSRGINAVSVATPAIRPVSLADFAASDNKGQNGLPKPPVRPQPIASEPRPIVDLVVASTPLTTTDVPAALTPEPPPSREANIAVVATAAADPVADAFATAGRRTGNAFQTGVAKTGGAFRTAGRAIRSIF